MSVVHIELTSDYGYVIFVALASMLLVFAFGEKVALSRKKYGVKLPLMYSEKEQVFNCIQRVHQNTLEGFSTYLALLFVSGLYYPIFSSACGVLWIVGRIFYAIGYYSGDPSKRMWGSFGMIGLLALIGSTGKFAWDIVHAA